MDNSIHDYEESLKHLERQKEQLELVMQTMGEEWEKSGPGIDWFKMLQNIKHSPTNDNTATTTATATIVDDEELAPDPTLDTKGDFIDILRQQPQRPSPEYLQSLLHVNETLLAQSLAASPMMTIDPDDSYISFSNIMTIASPQTDASSSDVCSTPGLYSSSSAPTTPYDENDKVLHLTKRQDGLDDKNTPADPIAPVTLRLS